MKFELELPVDLDVDLDGGPEQLGFANDVCFARGMLCSMCFARCALLVYAGHGYSNSEYSCT
jgi:hypothetical protein